MRLFCGKVEDMHLFCGKVEDYMHLFCGKVEDMHLFCGKVEDMHLFWQAHCDYFILKSFVKRVAETVDGPVHAALQTLCALYGIHTVLQATGVFLQVSTQTGRLIL